MLWTLARSVQGCHNHTGPACSSSPHVPQVGVHKAFSKTTSHCFFNFPHACMHAQLLIHVRLSVTPWAVAHQAPLSMEFSRQEYWSGWPFPTPGNLPDSGDDLCFSCLSCVGRQDSLPLSHLGSNKAWLSIIGVESKNSLHLPHTVLEI